jgi:hypothetical protein
MLIVKHILVSKLRCVDIGDFFFDKLILEIIIAIELFIFFGHIVLILSSHIFQCLCIVSNLNYNDWHRCFDPKKL